MSEDNTKPKSEGEKTKGENNPNTDTASMKQEVISIITESDKNMKKCMCRWCIILYYFLMLLSTFGFLWLICHVFKSTPELEPHCCRACSSTMPELVVFRWKMFLNIFVILLLSLVFVWWMKYLGKLISNCREAMKPWQKKVTDAYAFILEMETMLFKVICENKKKELKGNIGDDKEDKSSSKPEDIEKMVEKYVKETIEATMEEKRKELTEVGWMVRLKESKDKPTKDKPSEDKPNA